jgi:hypothetical protein
MGIDANKFNMFRIRRMKWCLNFLRIYCVIVLKTIIYNISCPILVLATVISLMPDMRHSDAKNDVKIIRGQLLSEKMRVEISPDIFLNFSVSTT